jgi:hypothetical protein
MLAAAALTAFAADKKKSLNHRQEYQSRLPEIEQAMGGSA